MSDKKINQDDAIYGVYEDDLTAKCQVGRILDICKKAEKMDGRFLDLGLGEGSTPELLSKSFNDYEIIEGSKKVIDYYKEKHTNDSIKITLSFFEDFESDIKYDVINMGFVLEHVKDPVNVIRHYRDFLKDDGIMFISVPNAESLHRRVGHYAGYLPDVHDLSETDIRLGHVRYYDKNSFEKDIISAGMRIVKMEGMFLKPVTSGQLNSLNLPEEVLDGFCTVGTDYPELCNSLFAEVVK